MPTVPVAVEHELHTAIQSQGVGEFGITAGRSRTPIFAVLLRAEERVTETPTSRRKKDAVTVWACNLITAVTPLCGP